MHPGPYQQLLEIVVDQIGQAAAFPLLGEGQFGREHEELLGPPSQLLVGRGQLGRPFPNTGLQLLLGFQEFLLSLFAPGDVFSEAGDPVDLPPLVANGKGLCEDPADRTVGPADPVFGKLGVEQIPGGPSLDLLQDPFAVLFNHGVQPGAGVPVQALA